MPVLSSEEIEAIIRSRSAEQPKASPFFIIVFWILVVLALLVVVLANSFGGYAN